LDFAVEALLPDGQGGILCISPSAALSEDFHYVVAFPVNKK